MLNSKQIEFYLNHTEGYKKITTLENEVEVEWHTYENKGVRTFTVMARNLHHSINCDEITKELRVEEVAQKLKNITINNKIDNICLSLYVLIFDTS